jgi:hypothetical protein
MFRQTRGVVVGYPDELRLGPPDDSLMKRLAAASGGKFNPTAAEVFNAGTRVAQRATPLWPYLLMAALMAFLVDVALRRIDFSLWIGQSMNLSAVPRTATAARKHVLDSLALASRKRQ